MKNKTALLLTELAILLAAFALAAAVCLRLFAWADTASGQDARKDTALVYAQNAVQALKLTRGDLAQAAQRYGGEVKDGLWELMLEDGSLLRARNRETDTELLGRATVTVVAQDGSVLAELDACWQEDGP